MGLKGRLDALRRQAGAATPEARGESTDLRRRLERLRRLPAVGAVRRGTGQPVSAEALATALGGRVVDPHLILVEHTWPLEHHHGDHPLALVRESAHPVAELPPDTVCLDTETTGLAGGTGTLAFMVGVAQHTTDGVRVRQWLISAFAGERAMLRQVTAVLAGAGRVVTYNGGGFDLPLLRGRHRLVTGKPLPEPAHTDLLHPVRRLFRESWPDCRLATVERELLRLHRVGDLPGAEAPAAWRACLAGDPGHRLADVLRHNAMDVLSLTTLPALLARAVARPERFGAAPRAAARDWLRAGRAGESLRVLENNLERLDSRGRHELARQLRRAGRMGEAVAVWTALAETGDALAAEQLAKYHEHVRRDYPAAIRLAEQLHETPQRRRRLDRLRQRLGRPAQLPLAL